MKTYSLVFALSLIDDEDAGTDAVQEALISALRNFATFRGVSLRSCHANQHLTSAHPWNGTLSNRQSLAVFMNNDGLH